MEKVIVKHSVLEYFFREDFPIFFYIDSDIFEASLLYKLCLSTTEIFGESVEKLER